MKKFYHRFTVPAWVTEHDLSGVDCSSLPVGIIDSIKHGIKRLESREPLATIILPAYNEEKYLLNTLSSLSSLRLPFPVELIVANNNSSDNTQQILDMVEVRNVFVKQQGVSYARQAALEVAKGKYILSADADTIYPEDWGVSFVQALGSCPEIACVHGKYSFLPSKNNKRWALALHEMGTDVVMGLRSNTRPYFNVMGCNSAFRREQALTVGGYDHALFHQNEDRGEDGFLAIKLCERFGGIKYVPSTDRVWTSDRRLVGEGSLGQAVTNRIQRYLFNDFNPLKRQAIPSFGTSSLHLSEGGQSKN
jgi:glycosyltransferase involved in cell wall biosynthesis